MTFVEILASSLLPYTNDRHKMTRPREIWDACTCISEIVVANVNVDANAWGTASSDNCVLKKQKPSTMVPSI